MLSLAQRKVLASLWLTGMMLSNGCGGGSAGESRSSEQAVKTLPGSLIIVGDSIMAGCAKSADQPLADYTMTTAHLVAEQGVRVANLSRPGNSMKHAVALRVEGGINFTQGGKLGTAIWIALGVGDFLSDFSTLEQFRERYRTLLNRIERTPAQKVFCAAPLLTGSDYEHRVNAEGANLEDYRQVVRDLAAAGHCALVDTSHWFDAADIYDESTMPDRLHLGAEGHARYATYLLREISGAY